MKNLLLRNLSEDQNAENSKKKKKHRISDQHQKDVIILSHKIITIISKTHH